MPRKTHIPAPEAAPRSLALFALIFCATLAAYFPALHGSPIWDDDAHLTRRALQSLHGLWRIWFDLGATQQYYPLLHSAFWTEHALWGDHVVGYHLVNVLLHATSACLVVLIARRLRIPGAWLAGLLFAVHPICVEAVAWISEQKSTLSAVFYLAAALLYLDFDQSRKRSRYYCALAFFVLALLTKTVTATLPAALLIVLWWLRERLEWRRDALPLVPWFLLGGGAGLFTAWVEAAYIGAAGSEFSLSLLQRLLLAGRAIWFYFAKIILPINLTFFYPRWTMDADALWQYLYPAAALAAAFVLWRYTRKSRAPFAALLCFAVVLFPALGFFNVYPFRYSFVADHFAYLATVPILIPVAALLVRVNRNLLPAAVVCLLAALTYAQASLYTDEKTLYTATLARNPEAWLAHNNLGNEIADTQPREAIAHFREAIRLNPDFWEAHLSLGNALLQQPGGLGPAIGEYEIALRLAPKSERVQTNLGNALLQAGRIDDATAHLRLAIEIQPANAEAHTDLGNAYLRLPGQLHDAIAEYQSALNAKPDFVEAHNNLGRTLAMSGHLPDAIAEFQAAIRIQPGYFSAHSNLGNALSQVPNRLPDAIAEYQTAIGLRPNSALAHNNLGYALSQLPGRLPEAIAEYRRALTLDPDFADAHYNLGSALVQSPATKLEGEGEMVTARRLAALRNAGSR